jgi:hypothetical protein
LGALVAFAILDFLVRQANEHYRALGFLGYVGLFGSVGIVVGALLWVVHALPRRAEETVRPDQTRQTPAPTEQQKLDAPIAAEKRTATASTPSPTLTRTERKSRAAPKKRLEPPTVAITYGNEDHKIYVRNQGTTKFYLWGNEMQSAGRKIEPEPREIPPGMNYHIEGEGLEKYLAARLDANGEVRERIDFFLADTQDQESVVSCIIWMKSKDGKTSIEIQQIKTSAKKWRNPSQPAS